EWAIAMKVGGENSGQALVWPKPKAPEWFARWMAVPAAARLEADWVRQAVSLGTHRDAARLLASVDAMVARAERMAAHGTVPAAAMADLRATRRRMATASDTAARQALWLAARRCLRAAVMAHHGLAAERLVFVKQFAAHTVRNITRSYPWKHKPGGDIFVLAGLKPDAGAEAVLKGRPGPGYVWGLDLWWDADRVVFAYASLPQWPPPVNTAHYLTEGNNVYKLRQEIEPLHIWEAPLDGSAPRQLTRHRYWSDFEPTYCASGDIVFASDRCGRSAQCGQESYDHANPNLYIMSPDGSRVRRLTDNKDIDRYPHSLDDGRIAYTHWEYQERHFMEVHAIWTVRPDGTMSDALFKHHMRAPCGLRDTRSIPGTGRLVSIATGHHTFAYGPVVIADPQQGTNAEAGIEILTPGVRVQEGKMAGTPSAGGGVADRGGLYHTPWALSDRCFLVSYAYARPRCPAPGGVDSNGFGIYLIDTYGNKELVTRDPLLSCVFPIPLRRRVRPPIPADVVSPGQQAAVCYVTDVCDGMPEVPRGTVKYIRVAQHVGWPLDDVRGAMHYIPGVAGQRHLGFRSWSPVRVLGDVPVEGDGSASFLVPSDTAVYFQALDARHMEVRRMRSMVSFKAGETRGCRGCHESEARAPAQAAAPMALRKPPRAPTPPPWGAQRLLGYEWLVQPILDRRCVRCHDGQQPKTPFDLRATRAPDGLLRSYHTLLGSVPGSKKRGRALVSCSDRFSNASVSKPLEFGSHKSPFILALLDALHQKEARLSDAEWLSLVTWVDANAPYHDAFYNKRRPDGGKPKRDVVPKLPVVTVDRGR
ncbi:MAG: hypothetical protein ISS72_01860, partial [Candidatus Brocadiae bacterium]|nr:hypothetical protein [Candidatus Brocadiia bacterium]